MRSNNSRGMSVMSLIGGLARKRRPTLLRESCGRAVSAERGSALLLVIGALALISVFAAVYVTIGQGDGRSSSAHELNRRVEDFGPVWGDYIAQQIADDRLDTVLRLELKTNNVGGPVGGTFGGPGGGGQNSSAKFEQVTARENTDRASTDWSVRSVRLRTVLPVEVRTGNATRLEFTPSGTVAGAWITTGTDPLAQLAELRFDHRVASDPWLASTEATYLGGGTDRFSIDRPFAEKHRISYLDKRDWAHISNISPDGMFVNLYNLRGDRGGYEAEPGYTPNLPNGYDYGAGGDPPKMSDGLSLLWKRDTGSDQGALQAMDVRRSMGGAPGGFWVPGYDAPVAWDLVFPNEDPENVPALWSTNQRFMLMPMDQTFFTYDRDGNPADWSSPDYPAYQYADADGDGLADSRWIELTDSSESTGTDSVFSFLAPTDGYRLFGAVRVVDLSALVNVNVATDGLVGPSDKGGWTPSAIDLRRILTMHDQGRELADWKVSASKGLALGSIKRDARPGQGDVYNDYSKYQLNAAGLSLGAAPTAGVDSNGAIIGRFSSDAIALAIETESSLGESDLGRLTGAPGTLRDDSRFVFNPANPEDNAALRQHFFNQRVGVDPADRVTLGGSDLGSGVFSMTDLSELMTFWGINDDEVNSRLEQVVFGRYDDLNNNLALTTSRLSPLISTRPTALDRRRHDTLNSQGDPSRPPETDGIVDPDSMALRAVSPRMRLTTFSGGASILSSAMASEQTLGDDEAPLRLEDFLRGLETGDTSVSDVYELFATTLAGSAELEDTWDASMPEFETMFYGHQGPELALTLSSFMTANLIDAYDEDNEPTPISVLVASQSSGSLGTDFDKNNQEGGAFPWENRKIKLGNIGDDGMSVPQGDESSVNRLAYTVYGVEAYPVLTEVSSMVIMTDASSNSSGIANGDDETAGAGGRPWEPAGGGGGPQPITIETNDWDAADAWNTNPDLALVAIAFQLTNPFDETISLGSDTKGDGAVLADDEYLFYLEYNGRLFKVGDFDEDTNEYKNVTLAPGESRNFYVVANDTADALGSTAGGIAHKWQLLAKGYDPVATVSEMDVVEWLGRQFDIGTSGGSFVTLDGPARMREFDATTGMPETFQGYENILKPAPTPALGRTAEDRKVRLWRRMELQTSGAFVGATKTPEHDLLVDRISDPTSGGGGGGLGAWDDGSPRLLPVPGNITSNEVAGTLAEDEGSASSTNDNSGFTMIFTGTIRRGDHPTTNAVQPTGEEGRGVLPGWMIESSSQTIASDRSVPPRGSGSKLRDADFDMSEDFAFDSFKDFIDETATAPGPAVPTIAKHPRAKRSVGGASKLIDRTVDGDPFYSPAMAPGEVVINPELGPDGRDVVATVTDPYSGTSREVPLVRASDLLLIPAVGWIETPDAANPLNFDDNQWITFGEALGYALGMTPDPTGAAATGPDRDPIKFLVDRSGGTHRYVLDRLHLRLDDFVSFYDQDTDGVYRASAASLDTQVGSGLPLALDLVSRFRRFGPEDAGESLTSKVMGRINLNTATLDTLRTVPLLSPSVETLVNGRREFWGFDPQSPGTATNDLGPALDSPQSTPDIAAQLLSYRDRAPAEYRASSFDYSGVDIAQAGNVPFSYLSLDETGSAWANPTMAASVMVTNGGSSNLANPAAGSELGRTVITGIEGLREQAGFTSPAEVMAAIADEAAVNSLFGGTRYDQIRQNLPTTFGSDVDLAGDPLNIVSRRVTPMTGTPVTMTSDRLLYNNEGDEIANDYEEQLAVLDAVMSTTDVRSDTFAVWFVVHGYQESDVADLRPDDPLVPSFARRYIMVVDRSNVTQRGQRPRILMMREVPL